MIQLFLTTRFILGGPQAPPARRSASHLGALRGARVPPVDSEDEPLVPNLGKA